MARLTAAQADTALEVISDYSTGDTLKDIALDQAYTALQSSERPYLNSLQAALVLEALEAREDWDTAMDRLARKLGA